MCCRTHRSRTKPVIRSGIWWTRLPIQAGQSSSESRYVVSAHGSRVVRESVASQTTVMIPMGLRLQHQQLGCKQWYQVDLATGLQQQVQGHRRWYLVVDGIVLLWQQQQGHRNGYLVCTWLRQQKGRRPARDASRHCTPREDYMVVLELRWQWQQVKWHRQARPHRPSIQAKQQGCMLVRRGLWQQQQEQSHRLDMPRRPRTQAKWSRLSTSICWQNYSVPRPHSIGQVPGMANPYSVQRPHSVDQVLRMADLYVVPRVRNIGLVPGTAINGWISSKSCRDRFWWVPTMETQSKCRNLSSVLIVDNRFSIAGPNLVK